MMLDKNGVEIRTGCIVEITGAYFKNDNGLYFVQRSPGDPSWCGKDYSLKKISKAGKISKAKYSLCFWPIAVFTNDRFKAAAANEWNAAHAEIEVKAIRSTPTKTVKDTSTCKDVAGISKNLTPGLRPRPRERRK